MKKLFCLLNFLLFASISHATDISFTDNDFKLKLLSATASNNIAKNQSGISIVIDSNNDNQISESEALTVYELDVSGSGTIDDITGILFFTNLHVLNAENCSVVTVNLSGMSQLNEVSFKNNHSVVSINVNGCTGITVLNCRGNNLTTIDVSSLLNLNNLDAAINTLTTAFLKNGTNETIALGSNNLNYVCADESQINNVINMVGSGCVVNSYCTLPPGGNYNTITGQAVFDATSNGIDASDSRFSNININCTIGGNNLKTITNSSGNYTLMTNKIGNYTFSPIIENPSWFTITSQTGNFIDANNNVRTQNFAITPISTSKYDVEVMIAPINQAVLGQVATYEVMYRNKGNTPHTGQVVLNFNNLLLNFVSSTETLTYTGLGSRSLAYSNLLPFETRKFIVSLNLLPVTTLTSLLNFTATITPNGEEPSTQGDNTFNYSQNVVNTQSVNRIDCLETNLLPTTEIGEYLHYMINFQNTGTSTVDNIVIKSIFNPSQFDINSLQVVDATHPVSLVVANNEVLFQMRSANLGGPGGQGGILLKIKSNSNLNAGSTVINDAQIFFDYAAGTPTNTASTTYQNLSISDNKLDNSVKVYPNPTNDIINAEGDTTIKSIELYDLFGRLLQTNLINTNKTAIDVSQRATGTYFLKITTDEGQKVEQIEKK